MRKFIVLLFAVLLLLSACSQNEINGGPGTTKTDYIKSQGLSEGIYTISKGDTYFHIEAQEASEGVFVLPNSDTVFSPRIKFDLQKETFSIAYDEYLSYWNCGKFEVLDKQITCKTNDGKNTFIFNIIDDDTISFELNDSSYIQMETYKNLISAVDGAEFSHNESAENIPFTEYTVIRMLDMTENSDISTGSALQKFFEDDKYTYSYSSIKSDYVIVKFKNGEEMTVEDALEAGYISICHLDTWDIDYIKEAK